MSKLKNKKIITLLILFLAFCLRIYNLGLVPHGMTWDEAAIGYNGFAVLKYHRDEWLHIPISFQSFGDYKAPLAIYLNGIFTAIFGMNLWAVRLPFVLAAVFGVWGMGEVLTQVQMSNVKVQNNSKFLAMLLITLSPWHLHFTRAGFESGMALTLTVWAMYFLLKFFRENKNAYRNILLYVVLAIASIYTYHSSKIVVPLLSFTIILMNLKSFSNKFKYLLFGFMSGMALMAPFFYDSIRGNALQRGSTLIFSSVDSLSEGLILFFKQFLVHLSPQFLILGETPTLRHGDGHWGVLFTTTFLLCLIGFFFIVKKLVSTYSFKLQNPNIKRDSSTTLGMTTELFIILWIVVGIVPAALGNDGVPHANRALLALPGFILLAIYGFDQAIQFIKVSKINKILKGTHNEGDIAIKFFIGFFILIHSLLFLSYQKDYYTVFASQSADDFKDGYLETFQFIDDHEDEVEKVIFTSDYGQPYIYGLFVKQKSPLWYQAGGYIKYEFKDVNVGDLERSNTLVVGSKNDTDLIDERAEKLIYGSDGEIKFKIFRTLTSK